MCRGMAIGTSRDPSWRAFTWCRHVRSGRLAERCPDCRVRPECSNGESQLLRHRHGVHQASVDPSLGESVVGRDIGAAADLQYWLANRCPAGRRRVDEDRPDVRRPQPLQRDSVANPPSPRTMPAERLQQVIERHPGDVDGEIKVAVDRGLTPNQRVDPQPAGNPDAVKPCRVSDTQHSPVTGSRHAGVGVRYRPAPRPSTSTALTAEIRCWRNRRHIRLRRKRLCGVRWTLRVYTGRRPSRPSIYGPGPHGVADVRRR